MDLAQLERTSGIPQAMGRQIEAGRIIEARCEKMWLDLAAGKFKPYYSLFGVVGDSAGGEEIVIGKHHEFNFQILRTISQEGRILGEDPLMFVIQMTLMVEGKKVIWKRGKCAPWKEMK